MPEKNLNIVSFAGSLRKGSISRRLLKSSIELTPSAMNITELDIEEIPMFNADLEDAGTPSAIVELKKSFYMYNSPLNNFYCLDNIHRK